MSKLDILKMTVQFNELSLNIDKKEMMQFVLSAIGEYHPSCLELIDKYGTTIGANVSHDN